MNDVMVDLETMGVSNDAAIISIGAVEFDLTKYSLGREFYYVVDLQSSVDDGGVVDPSTVMWWLKQNNEARMGLLDGGIKIGWALERFSNWLRLGQNIWGNGANFDNVVLRRAYERAGMKTPWKYWNDRCFRTIRAMYDGVYMPANEKAHNALADAKWQAEYLVALAEAKGWSL